MSYLRDLAHNPVLYAAATVFLTIFLARAAWVGARNLPHFVAFLCWTLAWTVGVLIALFLGVIGLEAVETWKPGAIPPPDRWMPADLAAYLPWA